MSEMGIYSIFPHPWFCATSEILYPIQIVKLPNTMYYNNATMQTAQKMNIYTEAHEMNVICDVPF